ncbi:MAG TPA: small ribosomal subunit biogenesis GTPase RsgA [Gammaproteobacteria bacterium]|nr:small ribosomal subunit biogenesis GTPase RsgA [Gammaproteobacteria bacterium]
MQKKEKFSKSHKKSSHNPTAPKLLGTEREGLIIAHFGAYAEVEDEKGVPFRCYLRKNLDPLITGDRVLWQLEKDNTGIIVSGLPRKSLLARPDHHNQMKPIAANIDAVIIVVTPPPILSEYLIDRYLVAAEYLNIPCIILLNKMDLLDEKNRAETQKRLATYEKIAYPVMYSSTYARDGLDALRDFLCDKTAVLVGVSGVGKSSIIAALSAQTDIKIGDVSTKGSGKHTTTTTRLYHLPAGGNLIDSPGVREFALWHMSADDILSGFIEFKPFLDECKFRNCHHQKEPDCAVQQALLDNKISAKRFENYLEMMAELRLSS